MIVKCVWLFSGRSQTQAQHPNLTTRRSTSDLKASHLGNRDPPQQHTQAWKRSLQARALICVMFLSADFFMFSGLAQAQTQHPNCGGQPWGLARASIRRVENATIKLAPWSAWFKIVCASLPRRSQPKQLHLDCDCTWTAAPPT